MKENIFVKSAETRQKILNVLNQEIIEGEITKFTVAEIAEKTDMEKKAVAAVILRMLDMHEVERTMSKPRKYFAKVITTISAEDMIAGRSCDWKRNPSVDIPLTGISTVYEFGDKIIEKPKEHAKRIRPTRGFSPISTMF